MAAMSVAEVVEKVKKDDGFKAKFEADPLGTLSEAAFVSDPKFYRMAIGGLIAVLLLVVGGAIVAELWEVGAKQPKKSLPDGIIALAGTALGGLVGLFVRSPTDAG